MLCADGCAPSKSACISFCDRPVTSRGVVCPFTFVVGELCVCVCVNVYEKCTNKIRKNEKHANVKTTYYTILILCYTVLYCMRVRSERANERERAKKRREDTIMIKRFIQNAGKQIDTFRASNCP